MNKTKIEWTAQCIRVGCAACVISVPVLVFLSSLNSGVNGNPINTFLLTGPFSLNFYDHYLINIDGDGCYYDHSDFGGRKVKKILPEKRPDLTKEDNAYWMAKTGKSKSGNLLDGKQYLEFPKP